MEITNTVVVRTAIQKTETAEYKADYTEENGKLVRLQCNIHSAAHGDDEQGEYLGSIYLDNHTLSCSLPYSEQVAGHVDVVCSMISTITQTIPLYEPQQQTQTENTNQR